MQRYKRIMETALRVHSYIHLEFNAKLHQLEEVDEEKACEVTFD